MIRLDENCNKILTEKKQNISIIIWKIDKYEYLTDEEILTSVQRRVIEQTKFTYSSLGKALENQRKTIEDQGIKQVKAFKTF